MHPRGIIPAILLFSLAVFAQEPASTPPAAPADSAPSAAPATPPQQPPPISIEIDLAAQKAWILQDGQRVYETSISSGRTGHETPSGNFTVLEKDPDHQSSLYGRIVDDQGRILISDADCDTPLPAGGKFVQAPMKNFLRFDGAVGLHAGRLPGYPASHGCVRLPPSKAKLFFDIAETGMPVRVFGKAPRSVAPASRPAAAKTSATPVPVATPRPKGWFSWMKGKP